MMRSAAVLGLAGLLAVGTACGGGADPDAATTGPDPSNPTQAEPLLGDNGPPAKTPRPPFLALPDSDAKAKAFVEASEGRRLIGKPQRGPFGQGTTTTLLFEDGGEEPMMGFAVIGKKSEEEPVVVPFEGVGALSEPPTLIWASAGNGWEMVLVMKSEVDGKEVLKNRVYYWDGAGKKFVRDPVAEKKITTMSSPSAIRTALY